MLSRRQALLLIALVTACVLPPCTGVARRAGEVRDDGQAASLHDESLDRDGGSSIHPLLEAIGESAGEEAGDTSGGRDAEVETGTKNRQVRVAAIASTSGTEINWHPDNRDYSCGGCTWELLENGRMVWSAGPPDCGTSDVDPCPTGWEFNGDGKADEDLVRAIDANAFNATGLAGLITSISFVNNKLASVPVGLFSPLAALTSLDLGGNELTGFPSGFFTGMSALTELKLKINKISALDADIFSDLSGLENLQLEDNLLRSDSLPVDVFSPLSSLTTLSLRRNPLGFLDARLFSGIGTLKNLYLDDTQLSSIPLGVFDPLPNLEELSLRTNSLTRLEPKIFNRQKETEVMHLIEIDENSFVCQIDLISMFYQVRTQVYDVGYLDLPYCEEVSRPIPNTQHTGIPPSSLSEVSKHAP